MSDNKAWQSYEEVATYLLNQFADHFGLECVEGKQCVPGNCGTDWEIDAKGVANNGEGFLIVDHTTSRLNQESIAGLAFRIQDTGASGGIIVSPLDLQLGAKKVAAYTNVQHATLGPKSTTTQYVLQFLNKFFVGLNVTVGVNVTARARVFSADEMKAIEAMPKSDREEFLRTL